MAKSPLSSPPLPFAAHWALLTTVVLGLIPFFPYMAPSIQGMAATLLIWRLWLNYRAQPAPPKVLLLGVALLCAVLVQLTHHTLFGKDAGLALLLLLLPLKLLESRNRRDGRAAILLCCFMLTGQFLNAQTILVAAFVMLCAASIIITSAKLEHPSLAVRSATNIALRLLGGALPLMALLFVLFPRIEGPLWGMPLDAYSGVTGLPDRMRPGSIANLIQSGDIAFRVEFEGTPPPVKQRYWRGPVLTDFDGLEWRQRVQFVRSEPAYKVQGTGYHYTMTLEAHNHEWLLAMDYPTPPSIEALFSDDVSLLSRESVRSRIRYSLSSYPDTPVGLDAPSGMLRAALRLPAGNNPRTVALGTQLANTLSNPADRVAEALRFMHDDHLLYTLTPPITGANGADDFLFDTHKGFCEHFASSFAVLMRAAGVPTRIVTGYQGGEFNPLDGTLVVRQSDAHAWTEVWLPARGWIRIDPTAASAPQRIDSGIADALPQAEQIPMMLRGNSALLRKLRYQLEAIGNSWNQWILGYNSSRQEALLRALGFHATDWPMLIALLTSSAGLWILWLLWKLQPRRRRLDTLDKCWRQLCRKLARRGIQPHPWEGPCTFAARAAQQLPSHTATLHTMAECYATLRYAPRVGSSHMALAVLKQAVQQFNP